MKRQALGRGLSALLSEEYRESADVIGEIEVDKLVPNSRQPRSVFDDTALDELAASIKLTGLLQPIIVRRDGRRLEIVAGERRWRAAKKLGLKKISAIIRDLPPQKSLEAALVENVQRENLNPMEQARAFDWLIQDYGLSQEEVGERVGKDRTTVTNTLRLLRLPAEVQKQVAEGRLTMGHARALLTLGKAEQIKQVADRVVSEGLSVRKVEELVRATPTTVTPPTARKPRDAKDVHDRAAERKLEAVVGTKVVIRRSRRGGRIELSFYSEEELQRLFEVLTSEE